MNSPYPRGVWLNHMDEAVRWKDGFLGSPPGADTQRISQRHARGGMRAPRDEMCPIKKGAPNRSPTSQRRAVEGGYNAQWIAGRGRRQEAAAAREDASRKRGR